MDNSHIFCFVTLWHFLCLERLSHAYGRGLLQFISRCYLMGFDESLPTNSNSGYFSIDKTGNKVYVLAVVSEIAPFKALDAIVSSIDLVLLLAPCLATLTDTFKNKCVAK